MIQEILTGIAVSGAFVYTFYSFWKTMFSKSDRACGGGCPSCQAKDLLIKDINNKHQKPDLSSFKPVSSHQ